MEADFSGPAGDLRCPAVCRPRRRDRAAAVELAAAAHLWPAPDHLLAGPRTSGAVPNPLRRIRRPRLLPLPAHDSRGAGTIPSAHARTLRLPSAHPSGDRIVAHALDAFVVSGLGGMPAADSARSASYPPSMAS